MQSVVHLLYTERRFATKRKCNPSTHPVYWEYTGCVLGLHFLKAEMAYLSHFCRFTVLLFFYTSIVTKGESAMPIEEKRQIMKQIRTVEKDASGKVTKQSTKETAIVHSGEPDYIKIYTAMWLQFKQVSPSLTPLFLELVSRMSYADAKHPETSQTVYTGTPVSDQIMNALGWKKRMYQRGLAQLADAGAIKRVARGVYQINPHYAGKGSWRYSEKYQRGGVADLVATFNFSDGTNTTHITWDTDALPPELEIEEDEEINNLFASESEEPA